MSDFPAPDIQDLTTFVVHYSGLMDATITSDKDFWYYDHVSHTMGLNSTSLDKFYRLFRISGMGKYLYAF